MRVVGEDIEKVECLWDDDEDNMKLIHEFLDRINGNCDDEQRIFRQDEERCAPLLKKWGIVGAEMAIESVA